MEILVVILHQDRLQIQRHQALIKLAKKISRIYKFTIGNFVTTELLCLKKINFF